MIIRLKENTLESQQSDKVKEDNSDFNRFVMTCKKELRQNGYCICFSMDQIEELKKSIKIKYTLSDGIYYVEVEK